MHMKVMMMKYNMHVQNNKSIYKQDKNDIRTILSNKKIFILPKVVHRMVKAEFVEGTTNSGER